MSEDQKSKRRDFLKTAGAGLAGAAVLGAPAVHASTKTTIKWRMQTYAGAALAEHVIKPAIVRAIIFVAVDTRAYRRLPTIITFSSPGTWTALTIAGAPIVGVISGCGEAVAPVTTADVADVVSACLKSSPALRSALQPDTVCGFFAVR